MDILLETLGGLVRLLIGFLGVVAFSSPLEKERVYTVIRHRRRSRSACWCSTLPRRG